MGYVFFVLMCGNFGVHRLVQVLARLLLEIDNGLVDVHMWLFRRVSKHKPSLVAALDDFPVPILAEHWETEYIHEWYNPKT